MKTQIILPVLFLGLAVTACKKDRTCDCTYTVVSETSTQPGYVPMPGPTTSSSIKYSKVKKNNVLLTTCVSDVETSTNPDYAYDSTGTIKTYIVTRVTKSDCKVK